MSSHHCHATALAVSPSSSALLAVLYCRGGSAAMHRQRCCCTNSGAAHQAVVCSAASLFNDVPPRTHIYRINSVVCWRLEHLTAFVHLPHLGGWYHLNDTTSSLVRLRNVGNMPADGSWPAVRIMAEENRLQSTVCAYERIDLVDA